MVSVSQLITVAQLKYPSYSVFFAGPANSVNNIFNKTNLPFITAVYSYSAKTGTWSFCVVKAGSCSGTLTAMVDGAGYWVYATSSTIVLSFGGWVVQPGYPPPSYSLYKGWNLVGYKPEPTVGSETVSNYLSSLGNNYDPTHVYLYSSGTWSLLTPTDLLYPGEAIWVYVTSPATLTP